MVIIRAICVVVLVVGLLALAVLGPRWLMDQSAGNPDGQAACDLQDDGCRWQYDREYWQVSLTETGFANGLHEFRLDLSTDARLPRLHGVLRGESMYLGEYPVVMKTAGQPGHWTATFTAPLCTVQEEMVWRIELMSGNEPLAQVPYRLTFTAPGR
ncbi:MAG: hypothetical protein R3175_03195 [Marinobacter sp.]|uniref:hypothetical protein n=1 Tax=Marinobacter sp. TaxID=50741 RepID=UPI00299D6020|nr:hypothetical protein [Marinobacter sp.]MDX1755044.1 hypothetical protein [Marinobacter sp.]